MEIQDSLSIGTKSALDPMVQVHEIFFSLQGESTFVGRPCIFIRLTGCNLRCSYCDTEYAFSGGRALKVSEILRSLQQWNASLVELTGGEPLLQAGTPVLADRLLESGYTVLIETSGSEDISVLNARVVKIMDLKCPSSGEENRNRWQNLTHLTSQDEIKFVIGDRQDYLWARKIYYRLLKDLSCSILFSPVFEKLPNIDLATWILEDALPVRFQLQLHKYIWDPKTRGV